MRFLILLLLIAFFNSPHSYAQGLEDLEHSVAEADELLQQARGSQTARDSFEKASQSLAIAQDLRYEGGIARAAVLLAQVCVRTNRIEDALEFYLQAEEKLAPGEAAMPLVLDRSTLLDVYLGLGDLFFQEKLYGNARRYYRKATEYTQNDHVLLEKIADTFLHESRYDSTELIYQPLIARYEEQGDYPHLVQIYQKLANAEGRPPNDTTGLTYYRRIEKILESQGLPEERAVMYNNVGKQYAVRNDYKNALEYFRKAELQCEYINCDYKHIVYANLGIALHNTGNTKDGIGYLLLAASALKKQKDQSGQLAGLEHLIAEAYFSDEDIYNALTHVNEAIRLARDTKQKEVLARSYSTAADVYYRLYDFENAYKSYKEYLTLEESMRQQNQARQQRIEQQRAQLNAAESQIKYILARQYLKENELRAARYEAERLELKNKNLELDQQRKENELLYLSAQKDANEAQLREKTFQILQARFEAQKAEAEKKELLIKGLRQQEHIALVQRQTDSVRVAQLRQDQAFQQREQENFKRFAYGIGGLGLLTVLVMSLSWWFARRSSRRMKAKNREIEIQKNQIEEERHKSDRLLLNILPGEVAQELRMHGYATPRFYERATVVFTDFLNFTSLSEKLSPEQLIDELDTCFLGFDEICERHGLEKIKTIGDAYMCAGGLPVLNDTHPEDAVSAALEMMEWLQKRNETNPSAVFTAMRVGVHTGPVIAGVIGKNKFAYDIWGDAVNLASRLEELGEPGRINISGATWEAVKHRFPCTYRGKKEVHNKGLVDMYFVNSLSV